MRWFAPALLLAGCGVGVYNGPGEGEGPDGDPPIDGRFHPVGWADPAAHGPELNMQAQKCQSGGCHGADLTGTVLAPSCDSCHTPEEPQAWRSDCVFCHGGDESATGAPPRDLDGTSTNISFPAHTRHLTSAMMAAIDCTTCHVKPADVLDAGHVFDDTAGFAEVTFEGGRSAGGAYSIGTCANLYCHGDGRSPGSVATTAAAMTCGGCHSTRPNSGEHGEHRGDACADCHLDTTTDDQTIADVSVHIDGAVQNRFTVATVTITKNGTDIRCSGQCHDRNHQNDRW